MIEFKNVTKSYGRVTALRNLSLTIEYPGIYCLLGRNGAGKTTLLKALAGHIAATNGEVVVDGKNVSMLAMPSSVYFVAADASQFNVPLRALFRYATAINPEFESDFAIAIAQRFNLDLKKRYKQLSFGMKAMVNTLIALASGRDILLLDEPVLGFDPVMRKAFYDMLFESVAEKPKTVIVSTHIIDEIAKVAERLIIIDEGQIRLYCELTEIDEKAYCVTGPAEHVTAATDGLNIIGQQAAGAFLSRHIFDTRIDPSDKYSITALGLQDFFVGLVGNEKEVF